jgi:hypothetical protein
MSPPESLPTGRFIKKPPKTRTAPTRARHASCKRPREACVTLCHLRKRAVARTLFSLPRVPRGGLPFGDGPPAAPTSACVIAFAFTLDPLPRRASSPKPQAAGLFHQKPPKTRSAPTHARHSACKRPPKLFSPIVTLQISPPRPSWAALSHALERLPEPCIMRGSFAQISKGVRP